MQANELAKKTLRSASLLSSLFNRWWIQLTIQICTSCAVMIMLRMRMIAVVVNWCLSSKSCVLLVLVRVKLKKCFR